MKDEIRKNRETARQVKRDTHRQKRSEKKLNGKTGLQRKVVE